MNMPDGMIIHIVITNCTFFARDMRDPLPGGAILTDDQEIRVVNNALDSSVEEVLRKRLDSKAILEDTNQLFPGQIVFRGGQPLEILQNGIDFFLWMRHHRGWPEKQAAVDAVHGLKQPPLIDQQVQYLQNIDRVLGGLQPFHALRYGF